MKLKIEVETVTFIRFVLVVIGFGLIAFAVYSARTALIMVAVALFLALALNTPVHSLTKYLPKKSRLLSTALAFLMIVVFLVGFFTLVVPPIIEQSAHVARQLPQMIEDGQDQISGVNEFIERHGLQSHVDDVVAEVQNQSSQWASSLGANIISGIGSVVSFLIATVLVLVMTFLMLLEGPAWINRIWSIYRDKDLLKRHKNLANNMYDVLRGYVTGQLGVALVAGIATALAVYALAWIFPNVPASLGLPAFAIATLFSLIPMFGATISGVLIAVLLALNDLSAGLIFGIYFIIYQQVESNFVSPKIQSRTIQLSALVVLVAATVGTYVGGIAGAIISVPIAGWAKVLIEDWLAHRPKHPPKSAAANVKSVVKKAISPKKVDKT